ncbi:MAG: cysteine--tRNA ligase [Bacilli bacterium]|nr:cysteine--tRNA ligase [Bacilli bacterium]
MKLYNSLTNKIEDFKPIKEGEVSMYVCGPTVYNDIHIGNARPVVFFDMVHRFFDYLGYNVKYVSNFTDIDDKIIKKASELSITEEEVAEKYINAYLDVCRGFNCMPYYANPRVTNTIDQITDYIKQLVDLGYAYQSGDNVYFRVRKAKQYGILSNQQLDNLEAGSRISIESGKEDPSDFVLWKLTSDDGKKWNSPFGKGRPGWHTECCVMINDIFKGQIDIHGGGNDLKFPHHENEIAQEMCMHDSTIANYWLHNARIDLAGEKMSKSLGNVVWAKDLLEKYPYQAVRLMILSNHYRQSIAYKEDLIERSCTEWEKINRAYLSLHRELELADVNFEGAEEVFLPEFLNNMADDFNTPNAFTTMFKLLKEINTSMRTAVKDYQVLATYKNSLSAMLNILGMIPDVKPLNKEEKEILLAWKKARAEKNFELADELRAKITEMGIKF